MASPKIVLMNYAPLRVPLTEPNLIPNPPTTGQSAGFPVRPLSGGGRLDSTGDSFRGGQESIVNKDRDR